VEEDDMKLVKFAGTITINDHDFDATDVRFAIQDALKCGKEYGELVVSAAQVMYSELRNTRRALDRNVLVVVRVGQADDWAAYIGAVPGKNHDHEEEIVAREGSKLPRETATLLFPQFDPAKYRK
jgi:hypothetical protein